MAIDVERQELEPQDTTDMGSPPYEDSAPASQPLDPPASPPPPPPHDSASALPADAASKRQRRPNVRLNEIGSESSLANVVEYLLKRKGQHGVGGARRGRPPRDDKLASPGKLPIKSKHLPRFNSEDKHGNGDGDGDGDGDGNGNGNGNGDGGDGNGYADGEHHAQEINPHSQEPYDKQKLTSKGKNRMAAALGKNRDIGTTIKKHAKRPKVIFPHAEGNGNNWMHKTADGFLEAADGCVYACSDTDKRVHSPSPHERPASLNFEGDSPRGLKKVKAATKRKKKMGTAFKLPSATNRAHKDGAVEEKEEPSISALQELRMQGPVWERSVPPLDDKVREWMQKIGLEKYAPVFQHHEVGDDVVPLLTLDDLKEMGITAVGARRKFFSEIMKLRKTVMHENDSLTEEK